MLTEIQQNKWRPIYARRRTLVSGGFKRVSKKRPCRICGKPTYCGFSTDEGTSICMRISAGARGPSRNGGNIHVHNEIPIITFPPTITIPYRESIPLAPLEIRDAVFQELIRISSASNYREELVTGQEVYFPEDCSRNKQPGTVRCLRQNETAQLSQVS